MVFRRQNSLNVVGNCCCVTKTRPGDRKCAVSVGNNSWWPKMVENACWLSEMGTGTGKSRKWQSGGSGKVITVKICQKWMLVVENGWKQSQTTDCCSKTVTGCQNLFENDLLLLFPVSLSLSVYSDVLFVWNLCISYALAVWVSEFPKKEGSCSETRKQVLLVVLKETGGWSYRQ